MDGWRIPSRRVSISEPLATLASVPSSVRVRISDHWATLSCTHYLPLTRSHSTNPHPHLTGLNRPHHTTCSSASAPFLHRHPSSAIIESIRRHISPFRCIQGPPPRAPCGSSCSSLVPLSSSPPLILHLHASRTAPWLYEKPLRLGVQYHLELPLSIPPGIQPTAANSSHQQPPASSLASAQLGLLPLTTELAVDNTGRGTHM